LFVAAVLEAVDALPAQVDLDPLAQARQRRVGEAIVAEQGQLAGAGVDLDQIGGEQIAMQLAGASDIAAQDGREALDECRGQDQPALGIEPAEADIAGLGAGPVTISGLPAENSTARASSTARAWLPNIARTSRCNSSGSAR
jgi:hypothetical protein